MKKTKTPLRVPVTIFEYQSSPPMKVDNRNSVLKKLLVLQEENKKIDTEISEAEDTFLYNVMDANFVNDSF